MIIILQAYRFFKSNKLKNSWQNIILAMHASVLLKSLNDVGNCESLDLFYSETDWRGRCGWLHNHTFYKAKQNIIIILHRATSWEAPSITWKQIWHKKRSSDSQLWKSYIVVTSTKIRTKDLSCQDKKANAKTFLERDHFRYRPICS